MPHALDIAALQRATAHQLLCAAIASDQPSRVAIGPYPSLDDYELAESNAGQVMHPPDLALGHLMASPDLDDDEDESCATARLRPGTLARFANGLSWPRIHDMTNNRRRTWWRAAVAEAENRGLLEWRKDERQWWLTAAGKAHVRGVS